MLYKSEIQLDRNLKTWDGRIRGLFLLASQNRTWDSGKSGSASELAG
jgi:hypothetical protein